MSRLAFIGLSFHKKTKSSQFLIDILNKYFSVDIFWDYEDNPNDNSNKNALINNYNIVVYFQIMPSVIKLKYSKCKNIILIPMYDHVIKYTDEEFMAYKNYKFLCFSRTLHIKLLKLKINSQYFQYFPKPKNEYITKYKKTNNYKIFFWQRSSELNFEVIKKLLPLNKIDTFYLHHVDKSSEKDTWFMPPSSKDIQDYNIKISSWFNSQNDFIKLLQECDIFIAPRLLEGIGMTFLEAMSLGKCVVAPNLPTMNEYIQDSKNGLLFDINKLELIDISNCKRIGADAQQFMQDGYKKWKEKEPDIINFINSKNKFTNQKIQNIPLYKSILFSKNLNTIEQYLINKFEDNSVVIYGAGTGAKLILSFIHKEVDFIVDIDNSLQGQYINNKLIKSPKSIENCIDKKIIISIFGREEKIYKYLKNILKIPIKNIIILELFN